MRPCRSPSSFFSFFCRRERTLLAGNWSFYCEDDVNVYIFIRSSKLDSFHIFQFTKMYLATRSRTLEKKKKEVELTISRGGVL